jgi:hypothetical protein
MSRKNQWGCSACAWELMRKSTIILCKAACDASVFAAIISTTASACVNYRLKCSFFKANSPALEIAPRYTG